jgi:hypothetical protein
VPATHDAIRRCSTCDEWDSRSASAATDTARWFSANPKTPAEQQRKEQTMTDQTQIPVPSEQILSWVQKKFSAFLRDLPEAERRAVPFALARGTTPAEADGQGYDASAVFTGLNNPLNSLSNICASVSTTCVSECSTWQGLATPNCYLNCMASYGCCSY